jgi:hypothetical protein
MKLSRFSVVSVLGVLLFLLLFAVAWLVPAWQPHEAYGGDANGTRATPPPIDGKDEEIARLKEGLAQSQADLAALARQVDALRKTSPSLPQPGVVQVDDTLIQWGTARSVQGTYTAVTFPKPFASPPVVTASVDGTVNANDAYVNVANAGEHKGDSFSILVVHPTAQGPAYDYPPRDVYWVAIGKVK